MADPVAQETAAIGAPATPGTGEEGVVIGACRRRTLPQIPIQSGRHRWPFAVDLRETIDLAIAAVRRAAAGMDLGDVADGPVPYPFHEGPDGVGGMSLVAHLRDQLAFRRLGPQRPHLGHGMRQGLLAIDVLAGLHRRHGDHRMGVVGRAHQHRVDPVAHLIQHLPVVLVSPRLREALEGPGGTAFVHVAEGDDVLVRHVGEIMSALAADAHRSEVDPAARWQRTLDPTQEGAGDDGESGGRQRGGEQGAAAHGRIPPMDGHQARCHDGPSMEDLPARNRLRCPSHDRLRMPCRRQRLQPARYGGFSRAVAASLLVKRMACSSYWSV